MNMCVNIYSINAHSDKYMGTYHAFQTLSCKTERFQVCVLGSFSPPMLWQHIGKPAVTFTSACETLWAVLSVFHFCFVFHSVL